MDIVTGAIIAATAALSKLGELVIEDGYKKLKALIAKKFGGDSDVVKSIEELERKPDSVGRRETVKEEIAAARVDQDEEIISAARSLLERLKAQPGGGQIVTQTVNGDYNIFTGIGDVTVNADPSKGR